MKRFIDGYCRVLAALMALLLATMVVLVFGNVVLRYGFNSGLAFSEEVSRWLFVWLTFMGGLRRGCVGFIAQSTTNLSFNRSCFDVVGDLFDFDR
jgi:hypothetical protein